MKFPTHQSRRATMPSKADNDNHANQCNPNNDEYWHSRGEDQRPDDWENLIAQKNHEG